MAKTPRRTLLLRVSGMAVVVAIGTTSWLRMTAPATPKATPAPVSASTGVPQWHPSTASPASSPEQRADQACNRDAAARVGPSTMVINSYGSDGKWTVNGGYTRSDGTLGRYVCVYQDVDGSTAIATG
jgi:hypothetical protein